MAKGVAGPCERMREASVGVEAAWALGALFGGLSRTTTQPTGGDGFVFGFRNVGRRQSGG